MKLGSYMIMLIAMMLILEFVGITTGLGVVLDAFGVNINSSGSLQTADLESSTFFGWLFGTSGVLTLLIASGVGAVIIGLFARSYDTSLVIVPLIVSVGTLFMSTFYNVILYINSFGQTWLTALIAMIFVPLGVGFAMSCSDYFAGR